MYVRVCSVRVRVCLCVFSSYIALIRHIVEAHERPLPVIHLLDPEFQVVPDVPRVHIPGQVGFELPVGLYGWCA